MTSFLFIYFKSWISLTEVHALNFSGVIAIVTLIQHKVLKDVLN
jgi:hypothetical protein